MGAGMYVTAICGIIYVCDLYNGNCTDCSKGGQPSHPWTEIWSQMLRSGLTVQLVLQFSPYLTSRA